MANKEIAELLDARHDNVKRTVERMADRGVFKLPPLEETSFRDTLGKTQRGTIYHLDKRSSLIVMAQLSPEFTARVVDRWQELEARVAAPALPNFRNPAEAARAWALQFERAEQQAQKVIQAGSKPLHRATRCTGPIRTRPQCDVGQAPGQNAKLIAVAQGCS